MNIVPVFEQERGEPSLKLIFYKETALGQLFFLIRQGSISGRLDDLPLQRPMLSSSGMSRGSSLEKYLDMQQVACLGFSIRR